MARLSVSRNIAPLVLAAALTASWASAAPARREPARAAAAPKGAFHQLWSLWSSLWSPLPASLDEGCHADPNGRCATQSSAAPPVTLDAGCHVDPNGLCVNGG